MKAYVFEADLWCEDCGLRIIKSLEEDGLKEDEDSDNWPQGPFEDGGGESDYPNHCAANADCINAEVFPKEKAGCFLENPLTGEGIGYVIGEVYSTIRSQKVSNVLRIWLDYYDIDFNEHVRSWI